ncbi:MAG: hypothetical protein GY851_08205 [bacterium]|nr:hypothetical protein [bacterium]
MSMIAHAVSMGLTAASGIAPLGHWPLENDAHDVSSRANHGSPNGVVFTDGHARFDGRGAHIEIPYDESLGLGADFSIGVWVHTERALDDTLGDILSRFDDATQRGFSLGIQSFAGVTSA